MATVEKGLEFSLASNQDPSKVLIESSKVDKIKNSLNSLLHPYGFHVEPFLISWYNQNVSSRMQLAVENPNHLAFCIISTPDMFEKSFLPHVFDWLEKSQTLTSAYTMFQWPKQFSPMDPLDRSVYLRLTNALSSLPNFMKNTGIDLKLQDAQWIPDYAIRPVNRMPLVHAPTAGHVSGMAYFHNQRDLDGKDNTGERKRLAGCSLHPYHGGWFGFRGVFLFPKLLCPALIQKLPRSPLSMPFDSEKILELLTEFTLNWRAQKWRDFGLPQHSTDKEKKSSNLLPRRYSLAARIFFNTPCKSRPELLELWFSEGVPKFSVLDC